MKREDELDAFKQSINLGQYAASQGYSLDRAASSRNCAVMRSPRDKIVIVTASNGHWLFFSVDDDDDNGTIIDFAQNRQGMNLGQVRKELRPWLEGSSVPQQSGGGDFLPSLEPVRKDTASVHARMTLMRPAGESDFLTNARAIPAALIASPRFAGRILEDGRGNAIFPHYGPDGICGYEVKNYSFTGFAPGGAKGLWCSRTQGDDSTLVIGEAALDVLSFAALQSDPHARYLSTGGSLNHTQPDLIRRAVSKMPAGATIVLAMDNDGGGEELAAKITAALPADLLEERSLEVQMPPTTGEDWNDVLRASMAEKASLHPTI